jgi:hypothetical protein
LVIEGPPDLKPVKFRDRVLRDRLGPPTAVSDDKGLNISLLRSFGVNIQTFEERFAKGPGSVDDRL